MKRYKISTGEELRVHTWNKKVRRVTLSRTIYTLDITRDATFFIKHEQGERPIIELDKSTYTHYASLGAHLLAGAIKMAAQIADAMDVLPWNRSADGFFTRQFFERMEDAVVRRLGKVPKPQ